MLSTPWLAAIVNFIFQVPVHQIAARKKSPTIRPCLMAIKVNLALKILPVKHWK
ncbi:hypothetical protein [Piscirickettsia salmonis]|uniref:hypothetical protein n=1 Tax=Piscirickettsia salmonis TaxID=1238 RepID=UPI0018C3357D|nr:hypothetical protein [Piscirickettsia salmonis]